MKQDICELKKLQDLATRPKVKDLIGIEVRKQETKLADLLEKEKTQKQNKDTAPATTASNQPKAYDYKITTYSWDQSDKFVKLYLTGLQGAKEVDDSCFEFKVSSASLFFKINGLKGKNW